MKEIFTNGIYIDGVSVVLGILVLTLVITWIVIDLTDLQRLKVAYRANFIRIGWENRKEWDSEQIRKYHALTGEPVVPLKHEVVNGKDCLVICFAEEAIEKGGD